MGVMLARKAWNELAALVLAEGANGIVQGAGNSRCQRETVLSLNSQTRPVSLSSP